MQPLNAVDIGECFTDISLTLQLLNWRMLVFLSCILHDFWTFIHEMSETLQNLSSCSFLWLSFSCSLHYFLKPSFETFRFCRDWEKSKILYSIKYIVKGFSLVIILLCSFIRYRCFVVIIPPQKKQCFYINNYTDVECNFHSEMIMVHLMLLCIFSFMITLCMSSNSYFISVYDLVSSFTVF